MKRIALASLLLAALGCGEPKAPPPGAEGSPDALNVEMPSDSPAPTDEKGAPTESSTEKDSSAGAPEEK